MDRGAFLLVATLVLSSFLTISGQAAEEVTFMYWWSGDQGVSLRNLVDALHAAQSDIRFVHNQTPGLGGAYEEKATVMVATGAPPDILAITDDNLRAMIAGGNNLFMDLTPFVTRDAASLASIPEQLLAPLKGRDGKIYAIPLFICLFFHGINVDHFNEGGVALPTPETWTWQNAYLTIGKKLTRDKNGDGTPDVWFTDEVSTYRMSWRHFIWQNGGSVLDETGRKPLMDTPAAREALQFMSDLIHVHRVHPPHGVGIDWFKGTAVVRRAQVLDFGAALAVGDSFNWDILPLPYNRQKAAAIIVNAVGIPVNAPDPEKSWKAIKLLANEMGQTLLGQVKMGTPIYPRIALNTVLKDPRLPITRPEVAIDLQSARSVTVPHNGRLHELNNNIVGPYIDRIRKGQIDPNTAAEEIQRQLLLLLE